MRFSPALLVLICAAATASPMRPEPSVSGLVTRGFEARTSADGITQAILLERSAPELKSWRVSVHQSRVLWSIAEPREGTYDWSAYDRLVEACKRAGIRWSPLLVAGGVDGVPAWFRKKPGYKNLTCVEHNLESPVVSRWYPQLRSSSLRFVRAFCERYGGSGVLHSVTLGTGGEDGRAALPGFESAAGASGHAHPGLWIRDEYAVDAFQIWLASKYGGSSPMRDAWGGTFQGIPYVQPFLKRDAPTERAWIDQLDWMAESNIQWAKLWLKEARASLPATPLYLRTQADAAPESGVDLAAQCRAAAEFHAGIQAVYSSRDHRAVPIRAGLAASSTSPAGIPLRLEVEGSLNSPVVSSSLFSSASSSSVLVLNVASLAASPSAKSALKALRSPRQVDSGRPSVAVYHPSTYLKLAGADPAPALQPLRDRFDFDLVSDSHVLEGALGRYKALVFVQGSVLESRALRDIHAWAKKGGIVIYPEGMGRLQTVERDEIYHRMLFGSRGPDKPSRVFSLSLRGNSVAYRDRVTAILGGAPELPAGERAALKRDSEEDGLLYSVIGAERMWLNVTALPKQKSGIKIPPYSVASEPLIESKPILPARTGSARSAGARSAAPRGSRG